MLSFQQFFSEATHVRPLNANAWDDSGYDHKHAIAAVPKESHGHHEEATKLGWKHSASYYHRPDTGGEQMHHIYTHPKHPGKELHLISGVSGGGHSHAYNPHGKTVFTQSKVTGPQQGSKMVGTRAKSRHVDTKYVAGSLKDHLDSSLKEAAEKLHSD